MDNFVYFVETVSGKDTLHGTAGMAYQTVISDGNNVTEHNNKKNPAYADTPMHDPAGIYLLKVNNRNTKARCEICTRTTLLASFWYLCC